MTIPGDILVVMLGEWEKIPRIYRIEARDAAKLLHCTRKAPTINYLVQMLIVLRLRNAALEARNFGQEN